MTSFPCSVRPEKFHPFMWRRKLWKLACAVVRCEMRTCTWVEVVGGSARGHLLKFLNIRVKPGVVRVVEAVTPGSIQRVPEYSSKETSEGGGREWEVDLNARQKLKWLLRMFRRTSEDPFPEKNIFLKKASLQGYCEGIWKYYQIKVWSKSEKKTEIWREKNVRFKWSSCSKDWERAGWERRERGSEAEIDKTKAVHTPIVQLLKG